MRWAGPLALRVIFRLVRSCCGVGWSGRNPSVEKMIQDIHGIAHVEEPVVIHVGGVGSVEELGSGEEEVTQQRNHVGDLDQTVGVGVTANEHS